MGKGAEKEKKSVPLMTEHLDFMAHMPTGDDLVLIVLKGHLLIEQQLERIIQTIVAHGQMIDDDQFGFALKCALARAMCWSQEKNPIWDFIGALNALRNDIAHSLGSDKTERRLKKALDAHESFLNAEEVNEIAEFGTPDRLKHAIMETMGFLGSYLADAGAYRMTVNEMYKARSSMNKVEESKPKK
jgi:hypothetical protein